MTTVPVAYPAEDTAAFEIALRALVSSLLYGWSRTYSSSQVPMHHVRVGVATCAWADQLADWVGSLVPPRSVGPDTSS
jgi:hypothetical protein